MKLFLFGCRGHCLIWIEIEGSFGFPFELLWIRKRLNTLKSGIDVGQGIIIGSGKFVKKNNRRALNKRRA